MGIAWFFILSCIMMVGRCSLNNFQNLGSWKASLVCVCVWKNSLWDLINWFFVINCVLEFARFGNCFIVLEVEQPNLVFLLYSFATNGFASFFEFRNRVRNFSSCSIRASIWIEFFLFWLQWQGWTRSRRSSPESCLMHYHGGGT